MPNRKQNTWVVCLVFILFTLGAKAQEKVELSVNWSDSIGSITNMHWSVNDFQAKNYTEVVQNNKDYFLKLKPGIIRLHQSGLVKSFVNEQSQCWDTTRIKLIFDNITQGYGDAKILFCFSDWPDFIAPSGDYVPLDKEQALIDFFAQLPGIIKSIGHRIDYYEFLNENDEAYSRSIGFTKYAELIKKLALRFKSELDKLDLDYTPKVGGPALRWPNETWYKPAIDILGNSIDFFSWHHYAAGPKESSATEEERNNQIFNNIDWMAGSAINSIRAYAENKGLNYEFFIDEFSVQYVWTPYESRTHNNVGAVWFASVIKRLAENGIDGAMMWNVRDGAYGLMPDNKSISAPGQLYLWGSKYLQGTIASSISSTSNIDLLPVEGKGGLHQLLIINRSKNTYEYTDPQSLLKIGQNESFHAFKIDESCVDNKHWDPKIADINNNVLQINPWSVVLLTSSSASSTPKVIKTGTTSTLHNRALIHWELENGQTGKCQIFVNSTLVGSTNDSQFWLENLQAKTNYTIGIACLNDFFETADTSFFDLTTKELPFLINDQTRGTQINTFKWSENWRKQISNEYFNKDYMTTSKNGEWFEISCFGEYFTLFGAHNNGGGQLAVYIDDVLTDTIKNVYIASDLYGDNGFLWESNPLDAGIHQLRFETISEGQFTVDYLTAYAHEYNTDIEMPSSITYLKEGVSYKSISLSWPTATDNLGIAGYFIRLDKKRIDTIYSPFFNIVDLEQSVGYDIGIVAFDAAGNESPVFSAMITTKKEEIVDVQKTAVFPNIDGEIDEVWKQGNHQSLINRETLSSDKSWYSLLWDKHYLYLMVHVDKTDASLAQSLIQVYIDGGNDKVGGIEQDDFWFSFDLAENTYVEKINSASSNNKISDNGDHYIFEASFKWSVMKISNPDTLTFLGFKLEISDKTNTINTLLESNRTEFSPSEITTEYLNLHLNAELLGLGKNELANKVEIFPNPVNDRLKIRFQNGTDFQKVQLFNQMGQEVYSCEVVEGNQIEIDVSNFKKGVYVLQLFGKAARSTHKIVTGL
ncbi:MAG: T9SS type A sorting domain-containing protein [Prolixibacteraceae bacterium]